jgi:hypothetical protein
MRLLTCWSNLMIVSEEFLKKDDLHIVPKKDASEPEKPYVPI